MNNNSDFFDDDDYDGSQIDPIPFPGADNNHGSTLPTRNSMLSDAASTVQSGKTFPMYIVINEYNKRQEDELDLKPGDKVKVITDDEEYGDGWYYGQNLRSMEEGLYPVMFTQIINSTEGDEKQKPSITKSNQVGSPVPLPAETSAAIHLPSNFSPTSNADESQSFSMDPYSPNQNNNFTSNNNNTTLPIARSSVYDNPASPYLADDPLSPPQNEQNSPAFNNNPRSSQYLPQSSPWSNELNNNMSPQSTDQNSQFNNNPNFESNTDTLNKMRNISVKSTMSDIDKALEELQVEDDINVNNNGYSNTNSQEEILRTKLQNRLSHYNIGNNNNDVTKSNNYPEEGENDITQNSNNAGFPSKYQTGLDQTINSNTTALNYTDKDTTLTQNNNSGSNFQLPRTDSQKRIRGQLSRASSQQRIPSSSVSIKHSGSGKNSPSFFANPSNEVSSENQFESSEERSSNPSKNIVSSSNYDITRASTWTPEEVTQYFLSKGFSDSDSNKFVEHKISGPILMELELAHLKEIEIGSFGTRFEMFKEIEHIKDVVKNGTGAESIHSKNDASSLMPAAPVNNTDGSSNSRENSVSQNNTSTNSRNQSSNSQMDSSNNSKRPMSLLLNGQRTNSAYLDDVSISQHNTADIINNNNLFSSPRRAPKPPSYPSPVQPPQSPLVSNKDSFTSKQQDYQSPNKPRFTNNPPNTQRMDTVRNNRLSFPNNSSTLDPMSQRGNTYQNNSIDDIQVSNLDSNRQQFTQNAVSSTPATDRVQRNSTQFSPSDSMRQQQMTSPRGQQNRMSVNQRAPSSNRATQANSVVSDVMQARHEAMVKEAEKQRNLTEAAKNKQMRQLPGRATSRQSAIFSGELQNISVREAIRDADCSGWMNKKSSGPMGQWKRRFFVLAGTRLAYYLNTSDQREHGVIDVTGHSFAQEDSSSNLGFGKKSFAFKLIPSQKGSSASQSRIHVFSVETPKEFRMWNTAFLKSSIDIDTSVPVISSYSTPTVSLTKAREMLQQAKEESLLREKQFNNAFDNMQWDAVKTTPKTQMEVRSPTQYQQQSITSGNNRPGVNRVGSQLNSPGVMRQNSGPVQGNSYSGSRIALQNTGPASTAAMYNNARNVSQQSNPTSYGNRMVSQNSNGSAGAVGSIGFAGPYMMASGVTPTIGRNNSRNMGN